MKITYFTPIIILLSAPSFGATDPKPDNSAVNQRDQTGSSVTADQQKNNRSDLKITQQIRQDINSDKSLSTYAHNVKIIATDGRVVLRGPVRSEEEKDRIAMSATRVAGSENVVNELEIKK